MNDRVNGSRLGFSLQIKTTAAAVAVASVGIFLLGAAVIGREKKVLEKQLVHRTELLAAAAAAGLGRGYAVAHSPELLRMMEVSEVRRMEVRTTGGKLLLDLQTTASPDRVRSVETHARSPELGPLLVTAEVSTAAADKAAAGATAALTALMLASIGLIAGAFIVCVRHQVLRPISKLSEAAAGISEEDLSRRVSGLPRDEIGDLADAFNTMMDRLEKTHGFLRLANGKLVELLNSVEKRRDFQVRFNNPHLIKCWIAQKCTSRECPAYGSANLRCWQIAGTHCGGAVSGVFAGKIGDCENCDVYRAGTSDITSRVGEVFNNMMFILETKAKELQRANETLEIKVQERTQELVIANRELETFTYSASHDLRSPLRRIEGFCSMLEADCAQGLGGKGSEYLGKVKSACGQMSAIMDDLLKLAQISRSALEPKKFDLCAEAKKVVARLTEAAPERKVEFLSPGEPLEVTADEGLIGEALTNLLGNAWKFTGKTGQPRVEFGVTAAAGGRAFYVRDNGSGFPMEFAGSLFKPFQRLHAQSQFPGTGIGLSIVQRIIERHGGKVWAESTEGSGATFYFTLPPQPRRP